jgi:hypothetical protein
MATERKVYVRLNEVASEEFELIQSELNMDQASSVVHYCIRQVANEIKRKNTKQAV